MLSERVSTQRTGRPSLRASQATMTSSGYEPILAPNPPPTSGAMTRTCSGARPRRAAMASLVPWAVCVLEYCSSRPSFHSAAAARTSSGQGATRWLTMRWRTTTSQPSKSDSSRPKASSKVTLVPASGKSRTDWAADSSRFITTGRGS